MTDVFALFGRGAFLTAPHTSSSSSACLPTSRPAPRSGLQLLKKIRRGRVFVKGPGLVLLNPDLDQVSTDIVTLGEPVQGLARRNS